MTVLDAYAIVALLRDEPAAAAVEALLVDPHAEPKISAINVAEVMDVLVRIHGRSATEVAERLDWLAAGGLVTVAVDDDIGRRAGVLHAGHYHRTRSPLSIADCVALATAVARDDTLATADAPLLEAARAEGCAIMPL